MFETAEVGRKVSREDYEQQLPGLRTQLLDMQRELDEAGIPVIIIVSGVEGAGKGEVVNRLNEWLDARGIQTHAFWDESDEERERPYYWRFWRKLPPRGSIGILFGSWYTQPIIRRVLGDYDESGLDEELRRIAEFEDMLTRDGVLIVKFWFHLSRQAQEKRFRKAVRKGRRLSRHEKEFSRHYDEFLAVSERAIRLTDTGECPWYLVEAENRRYRDLTVGRTLHEAVRQRLQHSQRHVCEPVVHDPLPPPTADAAVTILDNVDLSAQLTEREYSEALDKYQAQLNRLTWEAHENKHSCVAVFEGWDAAGKGGAIRRLTAAIDARLYRVISVAAPSDEERAQHYLWRFWRHIPRAGYVTLYDRSWYGRVLVERVEGFAAEDEWMRAYQEINSFEEQLHTHGILLAKIWVHISKDEQLQRFREREQIPWKQYKITDEDWRNREQWDVYETAVNDMIARTSTAHAPWTVIAGNDKRHARVQILKTLCRTLKHGIGD